MPQTKDYVVGLLVLCIMYFAHTCYAQMKDKVEALNRENSSLRLFLPQQYPTQQKTGQGTPPPTPTPPSSPFPPREDEIQERPQTHNPFPPRETEPQYGIDAPMNLPSYA